MPIPLLIDTDPGVDDMLAILLALASPELDVRAITTSYGNVGLDATTRNARRILALAARHDIPVAAGAERPLVHLAPGTASEIHGEDGMGGLAARLPEPSRAVERGGAIDLMARVLLEATQPVTIAALGPCTNLALLLAARPELRERIGQIIVMGGAASGGNTSAVAEFNIWCDPESAHRVFNDARPVTMIGLDVTREVPVDDDWLHELGSRGAIAAVAADITRSYNDYFRSRGRTSSSIHDAVTIAALIDPALVTTVPATVSVEGGLGPARGCTVVDRAAAAEAANPVSVGMAADGPAVRTLIAERIGGL